MIKKIVAAIALFSLSTLGLGVSESSATHSWASYHWARTTPFTLDLVDNLSGNWDPYLVTSSSDWNQSVVLDTAIVPGSVRNKSCKPTPGRVEVCNGKYGYNGWLGIAQVWVSGAHITQGVVKLNDTYFSQDRYNTPGWKQLIVCQEVAHTLGLDHQDENQTNANLGSCMDYTTSPLGPPDNLHPNLHDFEELETIYSHGDTTTTVAQATPSNKDITFVIRTR